MTMWEDRRAQVELRRQMLDAKKPVLRLPPMVGLTFLREEGEAVHKAIGGLSPDRPAIWDPACGAGDLAELLESRLGCLVAATDDRPTKWGAPGISFLDHSALLAPAVISCPPRRLAGRFARHALDLGAPYIAILAHTLALGGLERHQSLYSSDPPARMYVYSAPIRLRASTKDRIGHVWNPLVWLIWERGAPRQPLAWIPDAAVL